MPATPIIETTKAFSPAHRDGRYTSSVEILRAGNHSGIYAIIDRGTRDVLYVGESHTGRLFDTLTRHFRSWNVEPWRDAQGRRRGGTTYHRLAVLVAWAILPAREAQAAQFAEIQRLAPRDNTITGETAVADPIAPGRGRRGR